MNQIIKLNLEARTRELKQQNETERSIADILSKEVKQKISSTSVHRFFAGDVEATKHAIAANDRLKAKVAESALNVVQESLDIMSRLKLEMESARAFGGDPARMSGLYGQWIKSLELAAKLLGDLNPAGITVNNINIQTLKFEYSREISRFIHFVMEECDEPTKARLEARCMNNTVDDWVGSPSKHPELSPVPVRYVPEEPSPLPASRAVIEIEASRPLPQNSTISSITSSYNQGTVVQNTVPLKVRIM